MSDTKTKTIAKPLSANDLDAVIEIDKAASGASRRGYFEKRLKAATDNPRDYVFVGIFDGEDLAGFAFAQMSKGEFGKADSSASLDAIGVKKNRELKGVGQQLLDEVERILRKKGVGRVTSQVDWDQWSVLSFLAHEGFGLAP